MMVKRWIDIYLFLWVMTGVPTEQFNLGANNDVNYYPYSKSGYSEEEFITCDTCKVIVSCNLKKSYKGGHEIFIQLVDGKRNENNIVKGLLENYYLDPINHQHFIYVTKFHIAVLKTFNANEFPKDTVKCNITTSPPYYLEKQVTVDSKEHGQIRRGRKHLQCGWSNMSLGRSLAGYDADINQFPFFVLIKWDSSNSKDICSGTIITTRHVLTSANCLALRSPNDPTYVVVGEHEYNQDSKLKGNKVFPIERVICLEKEVGPAIALLKNRIAFTDQIGPVCMPVKETEVNIGDYLNTIVWSKELNTDICGMATRFVIKQYQMELINNQQCTPVAIYSQQKVITRLLCSVFIRTYYMNGTIIGAGNVGVPVLAVDPDSNMYYQVGIVEGHGEDSGYSERINSFYIHSYIDWINHVINETSDHLFAIK